MAHTTLIQIQSYLFIIIQPKVSFPFLFLRRIPTWYLLPHTIILIQSHILRLQVGSTTFKDFSNGFCFIHSFMNSKSLVNCFVWNQHFEKIAKKLHFGMPQEFYHRFMCIAPSSGCPLLNLNVLFKLILLEFWSCFDVFWWHLEWECSTFLEDWWKFIQIHQYYKYKLVHCWFLLFRVPYM